MVWIKPPSYAEGTETSVSAIVSGSASSFLAVTGAETSFFEVPLINLDALCFLSDAVEIFS